MPETIGPIHGKILKFNNGEFILDKTTIMTGASLVVIGVVSAWVKFADGVPEHRVTGPGQCHPTRKDLPDQDESMWKPGLSVVPEDPWCDTRYLYLIDRKTAEEITFVTTTVGGRRAIRTLGDQIKLYRRAPSNAGATPIVGLAAGKMKTENFGYKPCPNFKVTGWIRAADHGDEERLGPPPHELDDEIPF